MRTRCDKLFALVLDHLPHEKVLRRFEIGNRHLLDEAVSRGRGAYVALSHLGAHHVAGALLAAQGYRVAGVRAEREGAMRRYLEDRRAASDGQRVRYLFAGAYPRDIYRCFHENFVLGSAIDVQRARASHLRTTEVEMFGETRGVLVGPMQIALRCGAPIFQGLIISRSRFRYVLQIEGPLVDADAEDPTAELESAVRRYAENVERFARAYPCHLSKT